jgi:ATP-binding cassette subfamily E protein 1
LKRANVYIFDEPTSYLDIRQRIKISQFIRNLADQNTAVLIVEHDLIILDFLTDLIHLMYGKEACYGIVSQAKATRTGINVYLSGYLKEENIRFRDHEIKFAEHPPVKKTGHAKLTSWQGLEKKLGHFKLVAKRGQIHKHTVNGVLGANGIGKTSFVKILAQDIKQDKGDIEKITVSYKPQYLKSDSDELVANILKEAVAHHDTQLVRPLNLKPLLLKKLNELSGGELQRVSVALCLSKQADLYLLDEPSAYLDAEQRLTVSRVIREFIEHKGASALVVDHDLLFIDYLSDHLIVFEGDPALHGEVKGPFTMEEGMNKFLSELKITMRRETESLRPRINKLDSQMDRKQKSDNKLYYT